VHISYFDDGLKYATNLSGTWQISTVDPNKENGRYNSIVIDSNNKVHMSYEDGSSNNLNYTTNVSGPWEMFTIDSEEGTGSFTSIAIDSDDYIHISYYDNAHGALKYATNRPQR